MALMTAAFVALCWHVHADAHVQPQAGRDAPGEVAAGEIWAGEIWAAEPKPARATAWGESVVAAMLVSKVG